MQQISCRWDIRRRAWRQETQNLEDSYGIIRSQNQWPFLLKARSTSQRGKTRKKARRGLLKGMETQKLKLASALCWFLPAQLITGIFGPANDQLFCANMIRLSTYRQFIDPCQYTYNGHQIIGGSEGPVTERRSRFEPSNPHERGLEDRQANLSATQPPTFYLLCDCTNHKSW